MASVKMKLSHVVLLLVINAAYNVCQDGTRLLFCTTGTHYTLTFQPDTSAIIICLPSASLRALQINEADFPLIVCPSSALLTVGALIPAFLASSDCDHPNMVL